MSIIYEALRKTQRNREVRNMPARERVAVRNMDWLDKALLVFIVSLLLFILILYWPHFFKHKAQATLASAPAAAAPTVVTMNTEQAPTPASVAPAASAQVATAATPNNLFLNGVLVSDKEKLALINKKTFHVGDMVEGMKIVDIEIDSVQLDDNGRVVMLRTAS